MSVSLDRSAFMADSALSRGCAIGEVPGWSWHGPGLGNLETSHWPLTPFVSAMRDDVPAAARWLRVRAATRLRLAPIPVITVMEIVDNLLCG